MSRKRRRRKAGGSPSRSRPGPSTGRRPAETARPKRPLDEPSAASRASRPARVDPADPKPGLFGRPGIPSPFPPFGVTMARGARVVGASLPILAAAFVSVLATWATLVALGAEAPLRYLIVEMAVSPLHVFFDVDLILRLGGTATEALVATAALGVVRAVTFGVLLLLSAAALRGDRDVGEALRPLPKVALSLFAIYVAEMAIVVAGLQFLGGLFGPPITFAILALLGLHFLSFVPVVIAVERTSARDGLTRGLRAARLPAGRHLLLMLVYFMFCLYLVSGIPPLTPATPSILGWGFVLGVTFVHASVAAALAYRWLAVRDEPAVVAPPSKAREADTAGRRSG